ncbi:unnamed protein product, partial [Amoebophrya sp. A25]|eukprot:GSA25T00022380001.1
MLQISEFLTPEDRLALRQFTLADHEKETSNSPPEPRTPTQPAPFLKRHRAVGEAVQQGSSSGKMKLKASTSSVDRCAEMPSKEEEEEEQSGLQQKQKLLQDQQEQGKLWKMTRDREAQFFNQ